MEKLQLWPDIPPLWNPADNREQPWLEFYPHPDCGERGCVLVFPGGGYGVRAGHEAEPIARAANKAGFHGAVCHYRVQFREQPQALDLGPLYDAQRAIRILRAHAREWGIGKVATLGFSAGGHLCASAGTLWRSDAPAADDLAAHSAKPDAFVPCYPVITSEGTSIQRGSFLNLLGDDASQERIDQFSLERHVDAETPPCFIWHTADDEIVHLKNALIFTEYLQQHQVPVELHVFPHGKHGLGLAEDDPVVGQWWPLCIKWLAHYIS